MNGKWAMIEAEAREHRVLDILQRRYEADGFSFIRQPSGDALPVFLRETSPDAIAIGPTRKIVIEVKASRNLRDQGKLAQMAKLLEGQENWSFQIVYADDLSSSEGDLPAADKSAIEREVSVVKELIQNNNARAAFVLAWALLEAIVRRRVNGRMQHPKSANSIAELLEREGLVSIPDARKLWQMAALRNAVVHGDLDRSVRNDDAEFLIRTVETLNSSI
jgi:uncharacterized protein YutE (UPF0331/DUF86 family)